MVTIFDAILNTKVAWDVALQFTLVKCFRHPRLHAQEQEPLDATPLARCDDFHVYFEDLQEVQWNEYIAYKDDPQAQQLLWTHGGKADYEATNLEVVEHIALMIIAQTTDSLKRQTETLCHQTSVTYLNGQMTFTLDFMLKRQHLN